MSASDPNPRTPVNDGPAGEPTLPTALARDLARTLGPAAGTTLSTAVRARLADEARRRAQVAVDRRASRWRIGGGTLRWAGGFAAAAMVAVVGYVGFSSWNTPAPGPMGPAPTSTGQPGFGMAAAPVPAITGGMPVTEGGTGRYGNAADLAAFRGPDVVDVLAAARAAANGADGADAASAMLRRIVSLDNFIAAVPVPAGLAGGAAVACSVASVGRVSVVISVAWTADRTRELGEGVLS